MLRQDLHGPDLGPGGQLAWYALAAGSGLLLLKRVEDVPSDMAVVLLAPVYGCHGERRW